MIRLRPDEHAVVLDYIRSISGVKLDATKAYLIEGRLSTLAEEANCGSFTNLVQRARLDATHTLDRQIIDAITTNETFFFRDTAPFDLLRNKLVPDVIDRTRRNGIPRLRIWSAACSTGQEIYTIAIVLKEMLGDTSKYGVRLLATDISDQALARASRGHFSALETSRGLSSDLRAKYFSHSHGGWQVRDEIRAMASFRKLNLMQDFSSIGQFDIIFCRNVAIYFSDADRLSLFTRMQRNMEPEGYLVLGAMESLMGMCPQLESRTHVRAQYYQLKPSGLRR
ncbi:MAG: protein-glutamate O-methyltransferase CheR [Acidobacteria bacterium]|nr:protein-glutamate O-methyltransferase CheR [Acidobacteriota bacterium]